MYLDIASIDSVNCYISVYMECLVELKEIREKYKISIKDNLFNFQCFYLRKSEWLEKKSRNKKNFYRDLYIQ